MRVSTFQLLLCSRLVGLGFFFFELQTSGAERPADILADARDFTDDAFEVLPLHH